MIDPKEEVLEVVELDGIPALFIEERIGRESIPAGLYCYDIRHDDECQICILLLHIPEKLRMRA